MFCDLPLCLKRSDNHRIVVESGSLHVERTLEITYLGSLYNLVLNICLIRGLGMYGNLLSHSVGI